MYRKLVAHLAVALLFVACGEQTKLQEMPTAVAEQNPATKLVAKLRSDEATMRNPARFKREFERAQQGDIKSQVVLSGLYLLGELGTISWSELAFQVLEEQASNGNRDAMGFLQQIYAGKRFGNADKRDRWASRLRSALLEGVEKSDPAAMLAFAYELNSGDLFPSDKAKACEFFLRAAAAGEIAAQLPAGECHLKGKLGSSSDPKEGMRLVGLAANRGEVAAMVGLLDYMRDDGKQKQRVDDLANKILDANEPADAFWVAAAAERICPALVTFSANCLGKQSSQRDECRKCAQADIQVAIRLFEKAAELGNHFAALELAGIFSKRANMVLRNEGKANQWYERAAIMGNPFAQYELAKNFANGTAGLTKDGEQAVRWAREAAMQGQGEAQLLIGALYITGTGVPADGVLGYAWINLAIAKLASGGWDSEKRQAESMRAGLETTLSREDVAEAQRLSREWVEGNDILRSARSTKATPKVAELARATTGTAFLVSKDGYAVTNRHVVEGCKELRVAGFGQAIKVVAEDKVNDLALFQISGMHSETALILKDSSSMRQGEDVVVFGYPLNTLLSSGGNMTPGVISALTGLGNNSNQIQITAAIQPGSSGSAVMNRKGEVVGVVSMKLSDSKLVAATGQIGQTLNFAISGGTLKAFLDANMVAYRTSGLISFDKQAADLADSARRWTKVVECWK